ncbi:MAG TPA: aminotransferase class III-fold pyridoxal phosphate-dependent enzyme, partial [Steroidobacteraceae bacterium]
TLGALAVGNVDLYKEIYRPLLMDVITVPSPDCFARAPGESWAEHSRRQFAHMQAALADHPRVAEVRQRGMIVAIELTANKATREPFPWQERRGLIVYRHALTRGVLLRPVDNVVYFMPPYVITPEEIDLMVEVAREGIERATCD